MMRSVPSTKAAWPNELERLYATSRDGCVRIAYLMTGRHDVAEEIVQEAFMSCAPKWPSIEQPKVYVRTAVANGARNWLRRTKTRPRTLGNLARSPTPGA